MTPPTANGRRRREPLSRERVMAEAMALADAEGIISVTMRRLATRLGVEPMSLYHHVPGKEALLDGLVDAVFAEFALPASGADWRTALRERADSARAALGRHPWAVGLLDSRMNPGPATLRHQDAVIGCLLEAGFSFAMTGHAVAALDAYVYGFALQEASLPFEPGDDVGALAESLLEALPADAYPHLAAFAREHVMRPGYDFGAEFAYGLDLMLDGLERAARAEGEAGPRG